METLRAVAAYNRWANARVFARCLEVEPEGLGADARGTIGSVERTLKHLVMVEDVYLQFMTGGDPLHGQPDPQAARAWYEGHDLAWFAGNAEEVADGFERMLAGADEAYAAGEFQLPWFQIPLTRRQGLIQVFFHSAHHRTQVFSTLGDRGLEVPDLDYPDMLQEGRAT